MRIKRRNGNGMDGYGIKKRKQKENIMERGLL